jgi:uncharacterized protein YoxC
VTNFWNKTNALNEDIENKNSISEQKMTDVRDQIDRIRSIENNLRKHENILNSTLEKSGKYPIIKFIFYG